MSEVQSLTETALKDIAEAKDERALDQLRVDYLGKKGQLTGLLKSLGKLPPEERPAAGEKINQAKKIGRASCRERV